MRNNQVYRKKLTNATFGPELSLSFNYLNLNPTCRPAGRREPWNTEPKYLEKIHDIFAYTSKANTEHVEGMAIQSL